MTKLAHSGLKFTQDYLGFKCKYVSSIYSRSFFFVVSCETISLTWAIMVPKSEAADIKRKIQKTCAVNSIKRIFLIMSCFESSVINIADNQPALQERLQRYHLKQEVFSFTKLKMRWVAAVSSSYTNEKKNGGTFTIADSCKRCQHIIKTHQLQCQG
jgi:hypothetical protein